MPSCYLLFLPSALHHAYCVYADVFHIMKWNNTPKNTGSATSYYLKHTHANNNRELLSNKDLMMATRIIYNNKNNNNKQMSNLHFIMHQGFIDEKQWSQK